MSLISRRCVPIRQTGDRQRAQQIPFVCGSFCRQHDGTGASLELTQTFMIVLAYALFVPNLKALSIKLPESRYEGL